MYTCTGAAPEEAKNFDDFGPCSVRVVKEHHKY